MTHFYIREQKHSQRSSFDFRLTLYESHLNFNKKRAVLSVWPSQYLQVNGLPATIPFKW